MQRTLLKWDAFVRGRILYQYYETHVTYLWPPLLPGPSHRGLPCCCLPSLAASPVRPLSAPSDPH